MSDCVCDGGGVTGETSDPLGSKSGLRAVWHMGWKKEEFGEFSVESEVWRMYWEENSEIQWVKNNSTHMCICKD